MTLTTDPIIGRIARTAAALSAVLLVAACASPATIKTGETRAEVESRFPPKARVKLPDGAERWQYPTAPMGWSAWMVDFGPDGRVRSVSQALTPENFYKNIQPGLTKSDIQAMLGEPGIISWYPRLQQDVWTWRYWDQGEANPARQLDVFFAMADGRVISYTMTPDKAFDPGTGDRR
ncbi:MAG: hypothetical protein MUC55_08610 [Burkholderiales bacterium]|jgi:hypothetical protein|nr:hypothetical protein [Burkholderiales bacterium]